MKPRWIADTATSQVTPVQSIDRVAYEKNKFIHMKHGWALGLLGVLSPPQKSLKVFEVFGYLHNESHGKTII